MSDTVLPSDVPNMFSNPSTISDAILLNEDKKLHVSKAILSLCSPVFAAKFEVDSCIHFTGTKYADMVEFLLCIYPNTMKSIDQTNIDAVLPLADEYQVDNLKQKAQDFLLHHYDQKLDKSSSLETLVHYLYLCDKYGFKNVLDKAVAAVAMQRYSKFSELSEFKSLKMGVKFKILSRRMKYLEEPALEVLMSANRVYEHKEGKVSSIENSYRKNREILNELLECGMAEHQKEAGSCVKRKPDGTSQPNEGGKRRKQAGKKVEEVKPN